MKKKELAEHLSYLRDVSILDDSIYELFRMKMPERKKPGRPYFIETDRRVSMLFQEMKLDIHFERSIPLLAFTIAALLAQSDMNSPTHQHMEAMLRISGYSGEEMDQFAADNPHMTENAVIKRQLIPMVYLLARTMSDALVDEQKHKNRVRPTQSKSKRNNQNNQNSRSSQIGQNNQISQPLEYPMDRLKRLVAYMKDNSLLILTDNCTVDYNEFVVSFAAMQCHKQLIISEFDNVTEAEEKLDERMHQDFFSLMEKAKKMGRASGQKASLVGGPLSAPLSGGTLASPLAGTLSPMNPVDGRLFLPMGGSMGFPNLSALEASTILGRQLSLEEMKSMLPKEVREEAEVLIEKSNQRTNAYNALLDKRNEALDACTDAWEKIEHEFYMPVVAVGAFTSLLDGDDIYQTSLGAKIIIQIALRAELPLRVFAMPVLEDEEEWDECYPEENEKRLISSIVAENDTIKHRLGEDAELLVSLSSTISRFANMPFTAPLVARKSLIKLFKEYGYSERRARDIAVVIATLEQVNGKLNTDRWDKTFFEDFSGDRLSDDAESEVLPQITDPRIEAAENRAIQAERELKRLQQFNQRNRHETNAHLREIEQLQEELKKKEAEIKKRDELLELYENMPEEESDECSPDMSFPFHTDKKVVLYGGFPVFHKELEKYIPGIRIIEHAAHIDVGPVRSADIVFVQINKTSHSNYWNVCDNCRNFDVPFYHLNYASAKRCAAEMVKKIKKLG